MKIHTKTHNTMQAGIGNGARLVFAGMDSREGDFLFICGLVYGDSTRKSADYPC